MFDFAILPPEINSGRMYSGPGSGPIMSAAAAWDALAAELSWAARSYDSAIVGLVDSWHGPTSLAMAAAAAPYVAWLSATATQAEQAAAQARAAAAAFEMAFAATVPPAVIAANRALLAALVATNFFGQNIPAIAATEAQYAEMWAQDATAMYGYAASSAHAAALSLFTEPPPITRPAAQANPVTSAAAAATNLLSELSQLISSIPHALSGLTLPTSLSGLLAHLLPPGLEPVVAYGSLYASYGFYYPLSFLSGLLARAAALGGTAGLAGDTSLVDSVGQLVNGKLQLVASGLSGQLRGMGQSVSAQLARAASTGKLSVPQAWTHAAGPAMARAAPVLPQTSVSAPVASALPHDGGPSAQAMTGLLSGRGLGGPAAKEPTEKEDARESKPG